MKILNKEVSLYDRSPYCLDKENKESLLLKEMKELTEWHSGRCIEYKSFLDAIGYNPNNIASLSDVPFVPIRAFKELTMKSIADDDIFKVMMSSGTSGQRQSRIYLDKETALLQQKVLLRLLGDFVGNKRLPMLVIDTKSIIRESYLLQEALQLWDLILPLKRWSSFWMIKWT